MNQESKQQPDLVGTIYSAVAAAANTEVSRVDDEEDIFSKFGLDSLQTFHVLVSLENTFGIVIGEDETEFDQIRTFSGLRALVVHKVREAGNEIEGRKQP